MQVQPVAALRVAAVGGRAEGTGPGADDRPLVQAHPAADAAQRRYRPRHLAAAVGPDVEQQVAVLGHGVNEHPDQQVNRLPVKVVAVISPAAVEGLARLPGHRRLHQHRPGWLVLLGRAEVGGGRSSADLY